MSSTLTSVTPDSYAKEVLQSDVPVVVDFWGPNCGPCKALGPLVDKLAAAYEGRAKFVALNAETFRDFAKAQGVRAIPTLLIYAGGACVATAAGLTAAAQTRLELDKVL